MVKFLPAIFVQVREAPCTHGMFTLSKAAKKDINRFAANQKIMIPGLQKYNVATCRGWQARGGSIFLICVTMILTRVFFGNTGCVCSMVSDLHVVFRWF